MILTLLIFPMDYTYEEIWVDGPFAAYGDWNKYYPPPMQLLTLTVPEEFNDTSSPLKCFPWCCTGLKRKRKTITPPMIHPLSEYFSFSE